jgi:hemerythrin
MAHTCIAWTEDLETGHADIDNQHKQLVETINSLLNAYMNSKGHDEIKRTMKFMVNYASEHFSQEEELQKQSEYPGYEKHKLIHDQFRKIANGAYKDLLQDGPTEEFYGLLFRTFNGIREHLKGEDLTFVTYLKSRELQALG